MDLVWWSSVVVTGGKVDKEVDKEIYGWIKLTSESNISERILRRPNRMYTASLLYSCKKPDLNLMSLQMHPPHYRKRRGQLGNSKASAGQTQCVGKSVRQMT